MVDINKIESELRMWLEIYLQWLEENEPQATNTMEAVKLVLEEL